jgi:DNA-binding winged helix-turn-helix (wHTH) protein/Flp pilus assembly protein TadD
VDDSPRKTGELFEFRGFRLDESERLLFRGASPVSLPPKAFEVLLVLVRRAGRLVERDEMLRTVWSGVHVTEGSLHQKISLLRRELGDEGEPHRFIETVTKVGYRFVAPVSLVAPEVSSTSVVRRRRHRWALGTAATVLLVAGGVLFARRAAGPPPADVPTRDPEARREYLRARFFWNKRSPDDLLKAAESYEAAVRHDSRFAAAWAGLADTRVLLAVTSGRSLSEGARAAASRALELDDSLGAAHGTLAFEKFFFEWDMSGAGREFARAIELAPKDATIRQRHAFYLVCLGRADEAVAEIRRARDLDPASLSINEDVGDILFWAHHYGDAIEEFRKVSEMDVGTWWHGHLAFAYLYSGRLDEARAEFGLKHESATMDAVCRVFVSAAKGRLEEARVALAEVERDVAYVETHAESLASVHAAVGDVDGALRYLEKAYAERDFGLVFLGVSPPYDGLRKDPRFRDLLSRIGLA